MDNNVMNTDDEVRSPDAQGKEMEGNVKRVHRAKGIRALHPFFQLDPAKKSERRKQAAFLLHQKLDYERNCLAQAENTEAFMICGSLSIEKLASIRPSTKAMMKKINCISSHFLANYGDHFIVAIRDYCQEHGLDLDVGVDEPKKKVPKKLWTF